MVKQGREKESRLMKFYAAFKGVDLDADSKESSRERLEAIERRAQARLAGQDPDAAEKAGASFEDFGIDFETVP